MSLEREPTRRSGRRRSRRRRTGQIINSNHSDGDGTTWNHPVPRPILVLVSVLLPLLLGTASCSSISPDIRHHRRRRRQQGISIGSGTSLTTCTQNLLQADSNPRDESISQIEFVSFVASTLLDASDDPSCGDPAGSGGCVLYLDSDGTTLWNGSYQTPVTSFGLLPPDLVGLFNRFACGNANYGCLNGIDVSGAAREENGEGTLTDQEQAVLFRFCAGVEEAAEDLGRGEGGGGGTGSTTATTAPTTIAPTTETSSLPACPTKLFDEPPQATELRFQQSLSRAIADGGIALPPETGVTVTSSESALVLLPEATAPDPGNDDDRDDDDDENDDAASWRLPVIITGAVAAALLALPCFGFLLLRKRRTRTRTRTRNGKPKEAGRRVVTPKEASLENDVFRANLIPVDEYPPPRDVERGVDPFGPSSVANDDIHNPHPISAEKKPNPFIDEEDDNISSYSDGSSSGSSTGSSASSSSSSSSNNSSTSIESDYTESSSDSSRESSSTEDIHQNTAVQWTGVSNQDAEPTTPQANNASAAADTPRRLPTVEEMPDEDMSKSAMSSYMNLSSSTCDLSMYRAGVEALVKEACPDQMYRIEDMMVEYQGREQLLIGELSTMLAAKQRELDGDDDDDYDDDDDDSQGLASNSDEWSLNENESSRESNSRRSGKMDSTLSDSDMVGSDGKSLVNSGMTMDDENVYNSGGDSSTKNDADVSNSEVGEAPKSELSQSSVGEGNAGTVAVGVAAGGAMAGAGALLASQASGKGSMEDIDRIETSFDDSDSETSGWSSNSDGLSSMNSTSFETSESSIFEMTRASSLAAIAKASKMTEGLTSRLSDPTDPKVISRAARDDSSSPNGTGTGRSDEGSDHSSKLSEQKVSRKDLDDAIEAGDWQAVGATAALLAHAEVEDTDSIASHRSYSSRESDLSSMEIHRASEIEKLVQEGDWEGIIQAATKYDGTSDAGERVSNVSTISSNFRGSDLSRDISDIRTEVEELVCRVVPDEIDNVDEMMLQFQGREDELVETLKTMEERMSPAKTDTNMTSNPRGERRTSPKSDSEGGNSFGASTEDLFSSPCEIFEGESAVGSIETPQGSVYSSHEKRSSEESTSTSSEIGDIVLDSGSEEEYAGRN